MYVFRHRKTVPKLVQKAVPKTAPRDSAKDRARNNGTGLQSDQARPSMESLYQVYLNTDQNNLVDWGIDLKLMTKHCPKIMSEKKNEFQKTEKKLQWFDLKSAQEILRHDIHDNAPRVNRDCCATAFLISKHWQSHSAEPLGLGKTIF